MPVAKQQHGTVCSDREVSFWEKTSILGWTFSLPKFAVPLLTYRLVFPAHFFQKKGL